MQRLPPLGALSEDIMKRDSARLRLKMPALEKTELKAAVNFAEVLHPYRRTEMKNLALPFPICSDMPVLIKAASDTALFQKESLDAVHARQHSIKGLHEQEHSSVTVQRPRWRYLKECQRNQLVPRMPDFLLSTPKRGSPIEEADTKVISVRGEEMHDIDLQALKEPLQGTLTASSVRLDLSDNSFTDAAIAAFLEEFPTRNVSSLDLSRSGAGNLSVNVVIECVQSRWPKLQVLQMARTHLAENAWQALSLALSDIIPKRLELVDMSLGRTSQKAVLQLANMVTTARCLEHLDISGNFIFTKALKPLPRHWKQPKC
jgi:hypothetical protein